jgi:hypothetical protein
MLLSKHHAIKLLTVRSHELSVTSAIVSRINPHRPSVLRFGSLLMTPASGLSGSLYFLTMQTRIGACTALGIRKWS